jgi:hypothetical protein
VGIDAVLKSIETVFNDVLRAIDLCVKAELKLPALLLIYTLIDIAGWLDGKGANVRERFTTWVDTYLLPNSPLSCNSADLYGARCGLLHTYSASSDLSTAGKARKLFYSWHPTRVEDHTELIALNNEMALRLGRSPDEIIAIQGEQLISALREGVDKFLTDVARDSVRVADICARAMNFMVDHPNADLHKWIAAAREALGKS